MQNVYRTLLLFCFSLSLTSCFDLPEGFTGMGMKPVYISPDDFSVIYTTDPQETVDQGSFLVNGDFIYINERFKGIHVIDNSNSFDPQKVYFWNIPGNSEFSIDGDLLFADNSRHLITIDISDPSDIHYVSHVKDVYSGDNQNNNFPTDYIGIFECVDFKKGIVVDWEEEFLEDVNCEIAW